MATLAVVSASKRAIGRSGTIDVFREDVAYYWPLQSGNDVVSILNGVLFWLPVALVIDAFDLGRAVVQLLVAFAHQVYTWLVGGPSTPAHGLDQKTGLMDIECISWMLQTSLEKAAHLLTLESLATMDPLDDFNPTLVVNCFNVFVGCVKVINSTMVVIQGLEQLAMVSGICLLRAFSHLSVMDPASSVLGDVCRYYCGVFPPTTNFDSLPFSHGFSVIHSVFYPHQNHPWLDWGDYNPSSHEHVILAHALAKLAQSEYQKREGWEKKVPRWILRFVLHSLSLDPLPSTSIIVDCLSIIAIDLGCDISSTRTIVLGKRYVYTYYILISLTQN